MVKNIFFDFNGTILNDTELCFDIESKMLEKYNLKQVSLDFYLDNFMFPVKKYYELIGFDFNKLDYHQISEEFMSEYFSRYEKETKIYDGVEDLFKELKEDGYSLYVLSATEENALKKQLQFLGILKYFNDVIGTKDNLAKGKIEFAKEFIKHSEIDVTETVMIGDTYHDFEVSEELNIKPLLMTTGHNSRKQLSKTGAQLFDNYNELYNYIKK